MFDRLWVRIPEPYTGWTFFTLICCKNYIVCLKKAENKRKKRPGWPILKKLEEMAKHYFMRGEFEAPHLFKDLFQCWLHFTLVTAILRQLNILLL